jgi:hypothetical protein
MRSVRCALLWIALAATTVVVATIALREVVEFTDLDGGHGVRASAVPEPVITAAVVSVGRHAIGRPVAPGFVGLSLEYAAVRTYTGTTPSAIDPVLERLIGNLSPGQSPVLRIGGDSTDSTWWPTPGSVAPSGVRYTLTRSWLATTRALIRELHARVIAGVNLEAGRPALMVSEVRALLAGLGRHSVRAVEIGNEPDNYRKFPWYHAGQRAVYARSGKYTFAAFAHEVSRLRARLRSIPLAGPAVGGYRWLSHLGSFLGSEPHLALATFHRYPLNRCFVKSASPRYPTIRHLLSTAASSGFVARIRPYAAIAHAHGVPFRVDEMNSVACGGKRGVSDTFASALWALDTLFEMARVGVDGVNIHTFPGAAYELFTLDHSAGGWLATIHPEYYGLLMFERAAPPHARLLNITTTHASGLAAWATRSPSGTIRVLLINMALRGRLSIAVRLRLGTGGHAGKLERLTAPAASATRGVSIAGQSIATPTSTGTLAGREHLTVVHAALGSYDVTLGPASATLLTIPVSTR